jgi:hypothetical protein
MPREARKRVNSGGGSVEHELRADASPGGIYLDEIVLSRLEDRTERG